MKTNRKKFITLFSTVVGLAILSVVVAVLMNNNSGPDFTNKKPKEIKEYFKSEEYRKMSEKEQRAIKKKAYAPFYQKREEQFVEQAKTYSQLPPQQKVAYLDEMIEQIVRNAEKKQRYKKQNASGGTQGFSDNSGDGKKVRSGKGGKKLLSEDFRGWSEKMEPEKRAYIMALKEALRQRMEQRGIELSK